MAKIIFFLTSIVLASFAENSSKINYLIDNDLYNNFPQIQKLSTDISDDQKFKLYETQKKKPLIPVLVNTLTVPGIGSLIQKDYIGASISFAGYVGGISLLLIQGSRNAPDRFDPKYFPNTRYDEATYSKDTTDYFSSKRVLLATGISLAASAWIFSLIKPVIYSNRYNTKLGEALNLSYININPIGKKVELSFSF